MMISGSWRKKERRAALKVRPVSAVQLTWVRPSSLYSTGSSAVTILTSSEFNSLSMAYRLEDLPLPVGPVTRISPVGLRIIASSRRASAGSMPRLFNVSCFLSLSSIRMTIFSPYNAGKDETRISTTLFLIRPKLMLPSWGSIRSSMFIRAIIFRRGIIPSLNTAGHVQAVCMTPSFL